LRSERADLPFDAASLTEDYELGLKVREVAALPYFYALPAMTDGRWRPGSISPAPVPAAVAQKARWMAGIALAGWDRMGWSGGAPSAGCRLRDRQSLLAAALLFAGYLALALWLLLAPLRLIAGVDAAPFPSLLATLVKVNLVLLAWQMVLRAAFTSHAYGWREGMRSVPRAASPTACHGCRCGRFGALPPLRRTGQPRGARPRTSFPTAAAAE
jgi:adsorption protein B